jgi:electron transport complex protein RnfD
LRPFLNRTIFAFTETELPDFYLDLFVSPNPGIIADRGVFALLLGTIIIIAFQANRSLIPLLWLTVFAFFTRLAGGFPFGSGWWKGDILFALCTGGTFASAFILAADPVTNAKSYWCILGTAMVGGFLAWFFRYPGTEPYGAVFSVLVINALLPMVRNIESRWFYEKRGVS